MSQSKLQETYAKTIARDLQQALSLKNKMAVPQLKKIVVNMGVKDVLSDKKLLDKSALALTQITGQKPKVTKAKKSIAGFKLREGDQIGLVVTMRGNRMYLFLEKLIHIVLPRIRDFRGVKRTSFDGNGNYTLGFSEYTVFPEIDPGSVDRLQGLEISIITSAKKDDGALLLLEKLGVPFEKVKS